MSERSGGRNRRGGAEPFHDFCGPGAGALRRPSLAAAEPESWALFLRGNTLSAWVPVGALGGVVFWSLVNLVAVTT